MTKKRKEDDIPEITPAMIEAGVDALLRRGFGGAPGESMELLRVAVEEVLFAGFEFCPSSQKAAAGLQPPAPIKFDPIEITAAPGGANVCVRAFVPLPLGPLPTPEEHQQRYRAATDQLKAAFPELIPLLVLELTQPKTESR